ncbi:MAG: transcription repressor NadR [Firmicutes bacterium]|jgi:transcriptional regulator of NAD metabolism|nr:transcription repressor NadR [Bacillota bacterium]NLL87787.1 transcription repressor NadR [Bacillota bacterium]
MNSTSRRAAVLKYLKDAQKPITGGSLSQHFGVTRQVIVSDIAILRAQGEDIIGTPQGYIYNVPGKAVIRQKIAAIHSSGHDQIREELYTIVDHGARIQDVTVEHPIYGEITASLHIASRFDADQFIAKLAANNAEPLLVLTDGLHLHTIEAERIETFDAIRQALAEKGYLAEEK